MYKSCNNKIATRILYEWTHYGSFGIFVKRIRYSSHFMQYLSGACITLIWKSGKSVLNVLFLNSRHLIGCFINSVFLFFCLVCFYTILFNFICCLLVFLSVWLIRVLFKLFLVLLSQNLSKTPRTRWEYYSARL